MPLFLSKTNLKVTQNSLLNPLPSSLQRSSLSSLLFVRFYADLFAELFAAIFAELFAELDAEQYVSINNGKCGNRNDREFQLVNYRNINIDPFGGRNLYTSPHLQFFANDKNAQSYLT